MEYCPDCIVKLERQSKKLGILKVWLVCPKCGYRTRDDRQYQIDKDSKGFANLKKRVNGGNNFKG